MRQPRATSKIISNMKKFLTAIICLQCLLLDAAQKNPELKLSREASVEFALKNNLDLKAVKAGIDAARGRASQSGRLDNPVVGAEYGNDMLFSDEGEYSARVEISQRFPLFGRLAKEKKIGNLDIKLAALEYEEARRQLALQVETAYIDAAEKYAAAAAKREILRASDKLAAALKDASGKAEISQLEASRAQSESAKLKIEIMRDDVEAATALARLKNLLGLDSETQIKLADKLSEIPISPKEFSPDVLESRPDWLMFSLAAENANAQIALAKAGRFEDIEVGLFFEANTSIDEPVGKSREKALGLSVSVPLPLNSFDGTINEKLALRRQVQIRSASKENQIRSEIYVYRMRARKYSKILKSYKSEVENPNKDIYTQYIAARKNAQADISEVFGAWQTNLQLKLIRISITAEQARNSVSLKYALGANKNEK